MPSTYTDRLQGLTTSIAVKGPCRVATTANITLSGLQTIDGVAVLAGDRVLVKDQTAASENGIYTVASNEWVRALDFDGSRDVVGGTFVKVTSGSANAGTLWIVDGNGPLTPGSDAITFTGSLDAATLQALLENTGGSGMLGFTQSGTNPVHATVQSKERQILNAADFIGFDATGLSASTTAILNAINEAEDRVRCDVIIPTGALTGALTIPNGVGLIGPSTRAQLEFIAGDYVGITCTGTDFAIKNLELTSTAKSTGADILIACGTTTKNRADISNIITYDSLGFLTDSGSGDGFIATLNVADVQMKRLRGHGIDMTRLFAFGWFIKVAADFVDSSDGNYTGFKFNFNGLPAGAGGFNLTDCDVLGTMGTTAYANQRGYDIRNTSAVWVTNSRADTCCEIGWVFDDVGLVDAKGLLAGLCGSHGVYLTDVINSSFLGPRLYGRNYLGGAAGADGIRYVSGCSTTSITGGVARDFTGSGVSKAGIQAGGLLHSSIQLFNNTEYGVFSTGDSAMLNVGHQFGGNVIDDYTMAGSLDYLQASQLNAGTIANVGPGPVSG